VQGRAKADGQIDRETEPARDKEIGDKQGRDSDGVMSLSILCKETREQASETDKRQTYKRLSEIAAATDSLFLSESICLSCSGCLALYSISVFVLCPSLSLFSIAPLSLSALRLALSLAISLYLSVSLLYMSLFVSMSVSVSLSLGQTLWVCLVLCISCLSLCTSVSLPCLESARETRVPGV